MIDYSTLRPPPIPVGVPSTLLQRRPDIAASGARVRRAANASIGLARTAWYPELTLGATAGLSSGSLLNLLTWGSRVWTAGSCARSDDLRRRANGGLSFDRRKLPMTLLRLTRTDRPYSAHSSKWKITSPRLRILADRRPTLQAEGHEARPRIL